MGPNCGCNSLAKGGMPMAEKELTEKELAHAGCEAGLQDGVQKMTGSC